MWFFRRPVVFLCSAAVDEAWIRSTAFACRDAGLAAELAVCGDARLDPEITDAYERRGITVHDGISFADAARIRCRVAVTASSDLDRKIFPTRAKWFVHMPHSLASLHMVYPAGAFDGYDLLFAAGPHHVREFDALTAQRNLRNAGSRKVGYGKLDLFRAEPTRATDEREVLIAASWGPDNLLDRCGAELARTLVARGWRVTVRPHPLFMLEQAPIVIVLEGIEGVTVESSLGGDSAIHTASVMVGDYSGTSFEFAAHRRRPVVSVDVGLKETNPGWRMAGIEPIEIGLRPTLGPVVAPEIDAIVRGVESVNTGADDAAVSAFIYDRGGQSCGQQAAEILKELA